MMNDEERRILTGRKNAWFATLLPDGSPHLTPVWIDVDGDDVIVNTPEGTVKLANVRRDARVALAIESEEDRYRVVTLRGHVVGIDGPGPEVDAVIDRLSRRHDGSGWTLGEGERRFSVRIRPDRISLLEE